MSMPEGLKHVLEVYRRANKSGCTYPEAVRGVTADSRITAATIRAACTTNLGINTAEFEMFLDPHNSEDFRRLLLRKFPTWQDDIHNFINGVLGEGEKVSRSEIEKKVETLFPNEKKRLLDAVFLRSLVSDFEKWIQRNDAPLDIRESLKAHLRFAKSI